MKSHELMWVVAGLAAAQLSCVETPSASGWRLDPAVREMVVSGKIRGGKDVSAVAAVGGNRWLIASDETRGLQAARFDGANSITVEGIVPLLDGDGTEIDIEGLAVTAARDRVYATGSHALSRKRKEVESDRSLVFAVPVDSAGMVKRPELRKTSLRPILQADTALAPFIDKPAEENGLDIEGLAEKNGKLYFGLRAPNLDGRSVVLTVDAAALFSESPPSAAGRVDVALGPGRGIRDLVAIDEGFLILSGPSGMDDDGRGSAGFSLHLWNGTDTEAPVIGHLGAPPEGKAEAIAVIERTETSIDLAILFDGLKDGAPKRVRLVKPEP